MVTDDITTNEEFTDLLDKYLRSREAVQVDHGPLWEDFQRAKADLNEFVSGLKK